MTVLFFKVENTLNFEGTEAVAPSGRLGIASERVKDLKNKLIKLGPGAQLVLYGDWAKDWNFDDDKCTEDGKYLNKKLDRKGLHIMKSANTVEEYLSSHHVDNYEIL